MTEAKAFRQHFAEVKKGSDLGREDSIPVGISGHRIGSIWLPICSDKVHFRKLYISFHIYKC